MLGNIKLQEKKKFVAIRVIMRQHHKKYDILIVQLFDVD